MARGWMHPGSHGKSLKGNGLSIFLFARCSVTEFVTAFGGSLTGHIVYSRQETEDLRLTDRHNGDADAIPLSVRIA